MLTRRDILRMGLIGTAGALSPQLASRAFAAGGATTTTNGVGISPFLTQPFLEACPIMPVKSGLNGLGCEDHLTAGIMAGPLKAHVPFEGEKTKVGTYHQRYAQFAPQHAYELHVKEAKQKFHPSIPPTTVWGFDGQFPGPTFKARYGQPNLVRFYNELPASHIGFGIPSVTTHLHNAHTAPESDGNPSNFYGPGTCWDNHYPNVLAGFSTPEFGPSGDPKETLGTCWYHDHRQDFTAQNVYSGLEGFYLLFDDLDCDDETNPNGLRLPSGKYDIPLMFNDKVFGADGNLAYDFFSLDGILGDKMCVNGKIQPYLDVERRKYRFRLLNGGPSRVYAFAMSDGSGMTQIANDGNILPMPVVRGIVDPIAPDLNNYIVTGVAERHDIIIDFSKYGPNSRVYLVNMADQINGAAPTGRIAKTSTPLLQFRVGNLPLVPDQSVIPNKASLAAIGRTTMRDLPTIDLTKVVQNRSWQFARTNGAWTVNGKIYDASVVSASVRRDSREVWTLKGGSGWWHPVHIHFEEHQILSRNGVPFALPYEGRKDVVLLRGGETVEVYFHFRDWLGKYPMHCHNVVHEDHAMMVRWDMVDPTAAPTV
jgi:FtsP/CotA-like multicopper oxidase with cupredoxin domain